MQASFKERVYRMEFVDNGPLRERYLQLKARGDITAEYVGAQLGWWHSPTRGDRRRVMRTLGLVPQSDGHRSQHIRYETAVKLADILRLDYTDAGV